MDHPTGETHPRKDATRGEWMDDIRPTDIEDAVFIRLACVVIIGAVIVAAISILA